MSNIAIFPTAGVSPQFKSATERLDGAIVDAVNAARESGLPQGLVVALLHAHAHQQTRNLLEGA